VEQRAQVGVQCPQCHRKQFMEIEVETSLLGSPVAREIQAHLEAWMASRCPDHLNIIAEMMKN
jgi:hypothetical protein